MRELIHIMILIFILCAGEIQSQKQSTNSPISKINYPIEEQYGRSGDQSLLQMASNANNPFELIPTSTWKDELGILHQEYQQYHNGIKMEGSIQRIHSHRNRKYLITGSIFDVSQLPHKSAINKTQAERIAASSFAPKEKRVLDLENPTSLIYYYHQGDNQVYLCYKVVFS